MIDFETWWNSSSADEFRRLNDDMDGRVVRPVWDAAIRATLSSQKATSAAPSPEATQPTQAEAPSEREALNEIDLVVSVLRGYPMSMARDDAIRAAHQVRAALATQQAGQGEAVAEFMGRRRTPEGTTEFWGVMLCDSMNDPPKGAKLYTTPPAPQQPEALAQQERDIADRVCKLVAELPDRNSPEDWPEAMLVTGDELREIVSDALRAARSSEGGSNG